MVTSLWSLTQVQLCHNKDDVFEDDTPIPYVNKTPYSLDIPQAIVTALFAVISGFLLYLLKCWVDEGWLRYRRRYKELRAEVAYLILQYANVYTHIVDAPDARHEEASAEIRKAGARMGAFAIERPKHCLGVPSKMVLSDVSGELTGLSNGMCSKIDKNEMLDQNLRSVDRIRDMLNLEKEKNA